jgi:WD40 repeat protein
MLVKSRLLAVGLVGVLALVGYFALHASHASPAVFEKQAEGPMGPPELTDIDGLARSHDGHILATVNDNKTIALWDVASGKNLLVLQNRNNEWIFAPAFSPDGSLLATASNTQGDGHLLLWNPATGERLASIDNLSFPGCVSFNPAGTLIAVGGNTLYLVDPSSKAIVRQIDRPHQNGGAAPVVFSPNGDLLATGGRDGTVKLWKLPDLTLVRTFSVSDPGSSNVPPSEGGPARPIVSSLAFAHEMPRLAAVTLGGSVFVWDFERGKEIVHYDYSTASADLDLVKMRNWASFTSDDKWLLTTNQRGDGITLLGAKSKREVDDLLTLRKHAEMGNLDFSSTNGSVAFAYKVFHPGEPGPPSGKFEIWSLQLR